MYNTVFSRGRMLVVTGCVVACGLASVAAAATDPDLSAYYSFDEGSGETAADGSDYGNDGLLVGDPAWVAGQFGQALVLQPQTYVDLNGPEFQNRPKTGITIAAWVNHNGTGDMSLFDARNQVGKIATAEIPNEDKRKILGLNAIKLLGLDA